MSSELPKCPRCGTSDSVRVIGDHADRPFRRPAAQPSVIRTYRCKCGWLMTRSSSTSEPQEKQAG